MRAARSSVGAASAGYDEDRTTREAAMTTYPGEDEGLEATEVPATPTSTFDPDPGAFAEAEGADAGGFGEADGPGNADSGD
jgi:hypothetical protein